MMVPSIGPTPYTAHLTRPQVADLTRQLSPQAAAHVDQRLRGFIGTCSFAQVQRVLTEAITLYDPDLAEQRRKDAADHRHFDIDLDQLDTPHAHGLVHVDGLIDATDGADLDHAVARRATLLGKLGHDGSLDVRRAIAVGELARADFALDLEVVDEDTGEVAVASPGRKAVLHVHVSDAALGGGAPVGRWEDQQVPISTAQIREWLATPGTSVTVKPVIDLADHVPVDSYEIPDRLKERVRLRDHHCRYPWCGRRAASCDLDHAQAHAQGGATCPCNLVPACRSHHRAKTHSGWQYVVIDPGTYLWISPNNRHFLVDHRGTRALDPPARLEPQTMDVEHDYETDWPRVEVVPPCPGTHPPDG